MTKRVSANLIITAHMLRIPRQGITMDLLEMLIHLTVGLPIVMAAGLLLRPLHFRSVIISIFLCELGFMHYMEYLIYTHRIYEYPDLFMLLPAAASAGPLLYLYIQSITHDKKTMSAKEYLHFFPFLLVILVRLPYYFNPPGAKRQIVYDIIYNYQHIDMYIVSFAAMALLIAYVITCIVHLWRFIKIKNQAHRKILVLLILLIMMLAASLMEVVNIAKLHMSLLRFTLIFNSCMILLIFLLAMRYPYLLIFVTVPQKKRSYARSYLEGIDTEDLDRQLNLLMNEEKFFCDEDLSLGRLSDALEITPHQLSQFLNEHYKKNFNSYINGFRIAEAKKLLIEEPGRNALSIAYAAGFNSYSSFHRSFKKETGLTPAEFRQKKSGDSPH